jgi:nitroreductase
MLTAYSIGLGTCWIGLAQGYGKWEERARLPAAWVPVAPIIVGYPKAEMPPVARKEPEIRWVG